MPTRSNSTAVSRRVPQDACPPSLGGTYTSSILSSPTHHLSPLLLPLLQGSPSSSHTASAMFLRPEPSNFLPGESCVSLLCFSSCLPLPFSSGIPFQPTPAAHELLSYSSSVFRMSQHLNLFHLLPSSKVNPLPISIAPISSFLSSLTALTSSLHSLGKLLPQPSSRTFHQDQQPPTSCVQWLHLYPYPLGLLSSSCHCHMPLVFKNSGAHIRSPLGLSL